MFVTLALSVIGFIVYSVVAGAAIHYALTEYQTPGFGVVSESFSFAFDRVGTIIGVQIIQALIIAGLAVLSVFIMFIDFLISFAMIFLIMYVAVRLAPAQAIVIAEERPAVESVSRAWQITGGQFWHVFLAQLLLGIIVLIIDIGLAFAAGFILPFIVPDLFLILLLSSLISSLIVSSINYVYLPVLYKDLEARGISGDYDWWQ